MENNFNRNVLPLHLQIEIMCSVIDVRPSDFNVFHKFSNQYRHEKAVKTHAVIQYFSELHPLLTQESIADIFNITQCTVRKIKSIQRYEDQTYYNKIKESLQITFLSDADIDSYKNNIEAF